MHVEAVHVGVDSISGLGCHKPESQALGLECVQRRPGLGKGTSPARTVDEVGLVVRLRQDSRIRLALREHRERLLGTHRQDKCDLLRRVRESTAQNLLGRVPIRRQNHLLGVYEGSVPIKEHGLDHGSINTFRLVAASDWIPNASGILESGRACEMNRSIGMRPAAM